MHRKNLHLWQHSHTFGQYPPTRAVIARGVIICHTHILGNPKCPPMLPIPAFWTSDCDIFTDSATTRAFEFRLARLVPTQRSGHR